MGMLPIFVFVASTAIAQVNPEPQPSIAADAIATAIQQLGARDFEGRQRATTFLWQAGRAAEPALRRATESKDPEVRVRAQSVLDDFRYGVFADTPDDVAALVRQYRREDGKSRDLLWAQLLSAAPIETLVSIATAEPGTAERGAARRRQVLDRLERDRNIEYAVTLAEQWREEYGSSENASGLDEFVQRQVPYFLAKQQYERSESLLEQSATDGPGIRNWAAYLFLRGQLDDKIEELQHQITARPDSDDLIQVRTKLFHMLRLKGDEDGTLAVGRQLAAVDESLLRGLLFDRRDWAELATRQRDVLAADPDNIEALGFAAAYDRLAGNTAAFDKDIAAIREQAEKRFGGNGIEYCREALFLNGFTDEAIQLLTRKDAVAAFKLQIMRNQFADAFEAAGIGTTRQSREAWLRGVAESPDGSTTWQNNFQIAVQLARILATAGEQDESVEVFAQLANAVTNLRDGAQLRELAEAELQARMMEEAVAHAALAFDKDRDPAAVTLLFPKYRTSAKTWWDVFSELEPAEPTRQRLERVRNLFYQRLKHEEVIEQIAEAQARVEALESTHTSRIKWLHAIGETYVLHQENEKAQQCFESIAAQHAPAAIRLADTLAKREEWMAAAHWYDVAWRQAEQPYALYLYGEMLSKASAPTASAPVANADDAGEQAKLLARLLPLAGASRFDGLASQLAQRGLADVAQQECELLRRCSTWSDLQMFHAIGSLSQAVAEEDPLRAAAYSEQRMLNCLQESWHFTDQASYVRIPMEVHHARAKGLLKQNKIEEVIAELRMCQRIWPGELNIPEAFVPQLDEAGRSDVADELFDRAYALVDETCRIFPNSALHHNNAAWLAARCKRRLDDALAHATRASELVPNQAQYIDTLGEVYFQQGKTDLAIDCANRCIELEPMLAFYQEQLTRFKAAQGQPE